MTIPTPEASPEGVSRIRLKQVSKKPVSPLDTDVLSTIQSKIDKIAEQAGVPAEDRLSLDAMLQALPGRERRRVRLFLQGIKAQSDDHAVQQAADGFLSLTVKAWGR